MSPRAGGVSEVAEPMPGRMREAVDARAGQGAERQGLVVDGIHRSFRDRPILRDVSLSVPRGSCVLVNGANGVGKTTLLRVVAGIITPDGGSVSFDDMDPERDRRAYQRRLGFLAAGDRGLYARLTVRQNLALWAKLALLSKAEWLSSIEKSVTRFGLSDLANQRSDRLSMGQRQRVRLAMTFLHSPDLVLLDEPTTSLDQEGQDRIRDAVGEVVSRGGAVLCCAPSGEKHALDFDQVCTIEKATVSP